MKKILVLLLFLSSCGNEIDSKLDITMYLFIKSIQACEYDKAYSLLGKDLQQKKKYEDFIIYLKEYELYNCPNFEFKRVSYEDNIKNSVTGYNLKSVANFGFIIKNQPNKLLYCKTIVKKNEDRYSIVSFELMNLNESKLNKSFYEIDESKDIYNKRQRDHIDTIVKNMVKSSIEDINDFLKY